MNLLIRSINYSMLKYEAEQYSSELKRRVIVRCRESGHWKRQSKLEFSPRLVVQASRERKDLEH